MAKLAEIVNEDGDEYVGDLLKGEPHGEGTLTMANGDVYEGHFQKGLRHGQGKMTMQNG